MPELAYRKLDESEIAEELVCCPGWGLENGQLTKTFEFKTYKDGVVFSSAVGFVADNLNHHPDMLLTYAKVRVSVNTHDVGGISPFDFELARRIENL